MFRIGITALFLISAYAVASDDQPYSLKGFTIHMTLEDFEARSESFGGRFSGNMSLKQYTFSNGALTLGGAAVENATYDNRCNFLNGYTKCNTEIGFSMYGSATMSEVNAWAKPIRDKFPEHKWRHPRDWEAVDGELTWFRETVSPIPFTSLDGSKKFLMLSGDYEVKGGGAEETKSDADLTDF